MEATPATPAAFPLSEVFFSPALGSSCAPNRPATLFRKPTPKPSFSAVSSGFFSVAAFSVGFFFPSFSPVSAFSPAALEGGNEKDACQRNDPFDCSKLKNYREKHTTVRSTTTRTSGTRNSTWLTSIYF